ncbi:hypothetical protein [Devosia sp.]|uniref:hypothetical protein n=1 Tax=Devosia sp. TaxID=1871048 RepID=UPI00326631D7
MSSRANSDAARERRLKRIAARKGLTIMLVQKHTPKTRVHGGYMVRESEVYKVVFGNASYDYSADLDEVEEFLTADGSEDDE